MPLRRVRWYPIPEGGARTRLAIPGVWLFYVQPLPLVAHGLDDELDMRVYAEPSQSDA